MAETGASLSLEDTLQAIKDLPSTSPSYQSLVLYAADGILDLEPCVEELLEYADKRRHAVCVKLEEMGMPKPDQLAFNTVFKNYVDRVIMSHLVERLDNPGRLKCVVKTLEQARQQAIQRLHKVEQRRLPRGTNSMAIAGRSEAEDSIMGDEGRARDGRDIPEFSGILHVVQSKRADHPASSKHGDTGERRLVGTHEEAVAPVYEAETIQLQKVCSNRRQEVDADTQLAKTLESDQVNHSKARLPLHKLRSSLPHRKSPNRQRC